jgi:ComF family protein
MVYKQLARWRDWLLAGQCRLCAASTRHRSSLCPDCLAALPRQQPACPLCADRLPPAAAPDLPCGQCQQHPPLFASALALYTYAAPVDRLVQRVKYGGDLALARELGEQFATRVQKAGVETPDLLLPVPLHRSRLRSRGYNQALELARPVSRRMRIPVDITSISRSRATAPQQDLDRRARASNLRDAFAIHGEMKDRHVAIIDDVMTSGATVTSLARTLKRAGAGKISVWVLARA